MKRLLTALTVVLVLTGNTYAEPPLYEQIPEMFSLAPKPDGSPSGYGATWADDSRTITRGQLESQRYEQQQQAEELLRELEYQNQLIREQNELIEERGLERERLRLYGR